MPVYKRELVQGSRLEACFPQRKTLKNNEKFVVPVLDRMSPDSGLPEQLLQAAMQVAGRVVELF